MRYLFAAITLGGLIVWLVTPHVTPPAPRDPQVVTLSHRVGVDVFVQNAVASGKLHEDPQRHALRQAVLNAANRVEASPCDTRQRQALSDAFDAYLRHMTATSEEPVETLTLENGEVIDVSHHFNEPVDETARYALTTRCEN